VRRKLGIGPGSVLEWEEEGDVVVVRNAGRCTSEDICRAIFARRIPVSKTVEELDKGVRRPMKKKHARRWRQRLGPSGRVAKTGSRLLPRATLPLGTFDRNLSKLEGAEGL
jgi:bifunctional DNA-binding transcriptional regulator/antitoxin component of YhaV-PrlF toxin-antitoxin module